jgi:hypothetical protein
MDYSGVSSLAQAVLALNMAYLAFDRFHYENQISKLVKDAKEQLGPIRDNQRTDFAYKMLDLVAEGDADAWGSDQ